MAISYSVINHELLLLFKFAPGQFRFGEVKLSWEPLSLRRVT